MGNKKMLPYHLPYMVESNDFVLHDTLENICFLLLPKIYIEANQIYQPVMQHSKCNSRQLYLVKHNYL